AAAGAPAGAEQDREGGEDDDGTAGHRCSGDHAGELARWDRCRMWRAHTRITRAVAKGTRMPDPTGSSSTSWSPAGSSGSSASSGPTIGSSNGRVESNPGSTVVAGVWGGAVALGALVGGGVRAVVGGGDGAWIVMRCPGPGGAGPTTNGGD